MLGQAFVRCTTESTACGMAFLLQDEATSIGRVSVAWHGIDTAAAAGFDYDAVAAVDVL